VYFVDDSRFAGLTRMMAGLTSRRLAVATAAVSGLALAGQAAAKDDVNAEGKKRIRRGKKGKQGPQGPQGPASGVGAVMVTETCSLPGGAIGNTDACVVECPANTVVVGGGFEGPRFIDDLGIMIASHPIENPQGWRIQMEYLDLGQTFDIESYAICLPTT
jgi:hypothetical protein